jgi:hypothetical protein
VQHGGNPGKVIAHADTEILPKQHQAIATMSILHHTQARFCRSQASATIMR